MVPQKTAAQSRLPALRADVAVSRVGYDITGAEGFVLHDPLQHRYFRIGADAARMLSNWWRGTAADIARASGVPAQDVEGFAGFLTMSRLLVLPQGKHAEVHSEFERSQKSLVARVVHGYLMFRVPLFNPEVVLDAVLPVGRMLATRAVLLLIILMGVIGAYFTMRQWDQFSAAFVDAFSIEGAALYGVTLIGLKVMHEFGHGLMARHYGVRVPIMGVAFMLLAPMLYTEVSDAWRLASKWKRFAIAAAGVCVELASASVALFAWAFLPDGPWRSAAYFIAATAWIMSLAVNCSPFMRFDGYHMLGDAIGLHNIGPRAFAQANWRLRQFLFANDEAAPEYFAPVLRRFLIAFAWGTMIYRLFLFLGIAWLVYTMLPKAVGLPLAIVEVLFFILLPVWKELKEWHGMGWSKLFSTARGKVTAVVLMCFVALAFLPLDRSIQVPAILGPAEEAWIYPPESSQIVALHAQAMDHVVKGQLIAVLYVPDIAEKQRLAQLKLEGIDLRLNRLAADAEDLKQRQILQEQRLALQEELDGYAQRGALLSIRASMTGMVTARVNALREGQWLGQSDVLFHIIEPGGAVVTGLVGERFTERLATGAVVTFVTEDGVHRSVDGRLVEVGIPGGEGLTLNYLAQQNGGPLVATKDAATGKLVPVQGYLPVRIATERAAPERVLRGTAVVAAEPQSFAGIAFGRLVTVMLRESGF